ncbi:polymer-forming cytoskeletal protein [Flavobacterium panici]|nr:polymer-forming cytoskeletal protein [Flavobacterium panici]
MIFNLELRNLDIQKNTSNNTNKMQTFNFKLTTIAEIKTKYPFLTEDEKFDHFDEWEDGDFFLTAEENVNFEENFYLDLYEDKEKKWLAKLLNLPVKKMDEIRIEGIFINGDFSVNGSIINAEGDYGPYVFINGNVNCQSLLLGGANVEIKENVTAKEVVMTYYNHGNFNCLGSINSPVFIVTDHNTAFAERKNDLFYYNDRDEIDPKNECEYDDETDEEIISNELRKLLDNPLIETFEELERDLARGELVLKQNNPPAKTYQYWHDRVLANYRDLKLVPKEFKTEELCNLALNITFHALPFVDQDLITSELCEKLVSKDGFAIQVIPDEFITEALYFKAAENGTTLRLIPEDYYSEELILLVFKNGKHQPDINDVPSQFITENLLVEYVKIGKGLWIDKACKATGIDKLQVLKQVIDSGIEYLDNIFGNHFSKETVEYSFSVYKNQEDWKKYVQKYKQKFERLEK